MASIWLACSFRVLVVTCKVIDRLGNLIFIMSDVEWNEDEFLDASVHEDDVDEIDIELIRLVKNNPGLWNKSSKMYSNAIAKDRLWDSVASLLPIEMTGTAAAKRFRTLRTTFSRHFKKVRQSQPKSGAGSDWPIYQPAWPLYEELLFLTDVIKPRQTKSNIFAKPASVLKPRTGGNNNCNAALASNNSRSQQSQLSRSSSSAHTNSPMSQVHSSPTYSTQLQQNNTSSDMDQIGGSGECGLQKWNQVLYGNIAESDNESSVDSSVSTHERSTKRPNIRTPSPDNFFQKKKIKNDSDMNNLDKLAGALITMSQQMITQPVQTAQSQEEKASNPVDSEVESFMGIIKVLLQRICMQQRIPCLIEILNILQNFGNK